MGTEPRYIGLDAHKKHMVIAGVDAQQQVVLKPCKVRMINLAQWANKNLRPTDKIALEATGNAWSIYDQLRPLVQEVVVANAYKIKLIGASRAKTDKHDALILAKLMAANLMPSVWVPPVHVRELRSLTAHRKRFVKERAAAKNRLHSILYRHMIHLPPGDPFSTVNQFWWLELTISTVEKLRIRHELAHIQHLGQLITETECELAQLSATQPWSDQAVFLIQLPGIGLNSAMTILAAIGEVSRFPSATQLVGYAGLGASVRASGDTYRTGHITKQGRRELRTVLVECAWVAIRHADHWKQQYKKLTKRMSKQQAITVIARKLLAVIWHVLSKQDIDRYADMQRIARNCMTWATEHRLAALLGLSRLEFVRQQLECLGVEQTIVQMRYGSRTYQLAYRTA